MEKKEIFQNQKIAWVVCTRDANGNIKATSVPYVYNTDYTKIKDLNDGMVYEIDKYDTDQLKGIISKKYGFNIEFTEITRIQCLNAVFTYCSIRYAMASSEYGNSLIKDYKAYYTKKEIFRLTKLIDKFFAVRDKKNAKAGLIDKRLEEEHTF